jgi:hypothetical protein
MKTLTKLLCVGVSALALSLTSCAGIKSNSPKLYTQDFEYPHETNPYKFIPKNAKIVTVIVETQRGFMVGRWYNKQCESQEDYKKKFEEFGGGIPPKEIFLDTDGDEIPDLSVEKLNQLCEKYNKGKNLKRQYKGNPYNTKKFISKGFDVTI